MKTAPQTIASYPITDVFCITTVHHALRGFQHFGCNQSGVVAHLFQGSDGKEVGGPCPQPCPVSPPHQTWAYNTTSQDLVVHVDLKRAWSTEQNQLHCGQNRNKTLILKSLCRLVCACAYIVVGACVWVVFLSFSLFRLTGREVVIMTITM